ncbi:hypothetical protein ACJJTC_019602 [Scirpophaga incertulas]
MVSPRHFGKRGSLTEESKPFYEPKSIHSAPVTPCDSENSTWSDRTWMSRYTYESTSGCTPYAVSLLGASSATRPLRMTPCAGVAPEEYAMQHRPLRSRDRPLLFVRQFFL